MRVVRKQKSEVRRGVRRGVRKQKAEIRSEKSWKLWRENVDWMCKYVV